LEVYIGDARQVARPAAQDEGHGVLDEARVVSVSDELVVARAGIIPRRRDAELDATGGIGALRIGARGEAVVRAEVVEAGSADALVRSGGAAESAVVGPLAADVRDAGEVIDGASRGDRGADGSERDGGVEEDGGENVARDHRVHGRRVRE